MGKHWTLLRMAQCPECLQAGVPAKAASFARLDLHRAAKHGIKGKGAAAKVHAPFTSAENPAKRKAPRSRKAARRAAPELPTNRVPASPETMPQADLWDDL